MPGSHASRSTILITAGVAAAAIAPAAHAQAWERFIFDGPGTVTTFDVNVIEGFQTLQVTDAFLSGDRFSVRVLDGAFVVAEFDCSEPTVEGDQIGSDFDAAFVDDRWSSGEMALSEFGSFTVEITVTASPFGSGGAGWRLIEGVGEPPCRVDLDMDGLLTIFDFLEFQNLFDAGDLTADFDGDGSLTIFDFLAFQNEFDIGCE